MSSGNEIEAAIRKLAPADFSEIVRIIHLLEAQLHKAGKDQKKGFKGAMDKAFDHHAPLLKELAR